MMTDRDYERMERRNRTRRKSVVTSIIAAAVIFAAIVAIVIAVVALINKNNASGEPAETTAPTSQPTLYQPAAETSAQPSTAPQQQEATSSYQPATQPDYSEETSATQEQQEYADTPTQAPGRPEGTESPASAGALHFYANGKTSYGYNWTYSGGGGIVDVKCKYNFDTEQYDFTVTGLSEGVSDLTLIYYTWDDNTVSKNMTIKVGSDLSVTEY